MSNSLYITVVNNRIVHVYVYLCVATTICKTSQQFLRKNLFFWWSVSSEFDLHFPTCILLEYGGRNVTLTSNFNVHAWKTRNERSRKTCGLVSFSYYPQDPLRSITKQNWSLENQANKLKIGIENKQIEGSKKKKQASKCINRWWSIFTQGWVERVKLWFIVQSDITKDPIG